MSAIIVVVLNGGSKKVSASVVDVPSVVITPPVVTEPSKGQYLLVVESRTQDGSRELVNETMPRQEAIINANSEITLDRAAFDMYAARKLVRVTVDGVNVTWTNGEYTYVAKNNTTIIAYYEIAYVTLTLKSAVVGNTKTAPFAKTDISLKYNAVEQLYLKNPSGTGLAADAKGFDQYEGYTFSYFDVNGTKVTKAELKQMVNSSNAVINHYLEYWFKGNVTITAYYL